MYGSGQNTPVDAGDLSQQTHFHSEYCAEIVHIPAFLVSYFEHKAFVARQSYKMHVLFEIMNISIGCDNNNQLLRYDCY